MAEKSVEKDSLDSIIPSLEREGILLSEDQKERLDAFGALVKKWNARINLVGRREPVYSRHILDCLMLEKLPPPRDPPRVLDVGSGAGFPGLVMAILHRNWVVDSVDSTAKKITFQREAVRLLQVPSFNPVRADIYQWLEAQENHRAYHLMLSRAFTALPGLLEIADRALAPEGVLWAMKGKGWVEEWGSVPSVLAGKFEQVESPVVYRTGEESGEGVLLSFKKTAPNAE